MINKIISQNDNSTVVAEYIVKRTASSYQTEQQLENEFINQLIAQGYEYLSINNEEALINNLRKQIEKLNDYSFSNEE
jgi:type I restriction enzyme R subunit